MGFLRRHLICVTKVKIWRLDIAMSNNALEITIYHPYVLLLRHKLKRRKNPIRRYICSTANVLQE